MKFTQKIIIVSISICSLLIFGGIKNTFAATVHYYVDPSGTDNAGFGTSSGSGAFQTLQYAINNVANPTTDTIIINISGDAYTLNNTELSIDRNFTDLRLQGAGADVTIIQPAENPASSTSRVINIGTLENVTFEDLTVRYGRITSGSGPGIYHGSGSLVIRDSVIFDNDGSGSLVSGGIRAGGSLLIENSTFYNNDGSYMSYLMYGGSSDWVITNSTFFNNAGATYGGMYKNIGGNITITNSIFAQTESIYLQSNVNLFLKNSLVVNNSHGGTDVYYYNYSGTVTDNGNNIVGAEGGVGGATGPFFTDGVNNTIKVSHATTLSDLNISTSLALNDAENKTLTLALLEGSPAIDAGADGENNGVSVPTTDQRGGSRVGGTDIGPYEYNSVIGEPVILTLSPEDNATNVALDSNLVITFSRVVDAETGNITLYTSDGTVVETFDVTTDISGSGTNQITINPTNDLDNSTSYYVLIDATAFDDSNSTSFQGISDSSAWNFTTGDFLNPSISTTNPANNATNVALDSNLVITFSEIVDAETGNITLYTSDGAVVETFDVTRDISGSGTNQITINPTENFVRGGSYYVLIDATAFDDGASNSFSGISDSSVWYFEVLPKETSKSIGTYRNPIALKKMFNIELNNTDEKVVQSSETSLQEMNTEKINIITQRILKEQKEGEDVKLLQKNLNELGYVVAFSGAGSPGNETEYFGARTRSALRVFQETHGLQVDGIFGPKTQEVLLQKINNQ